MHYYEVAVLRAVYATSDTLTYQSESPLNIGAVVTIPVGKKIATGIVMDKSSKPSYATRDINSALEIPVIPSQLIDLTKWMSQYYQTPIGLVANSILPSGVNKKRRQSLKSLPKVTRKRTNYLLNKDQLFVVDTISLQSGSFLLQGVTGSGKTAVYIELSKRAYSANKSSIIVLPEIVLTPQIIGEFGQHFDNIISIHSSMSEADRHKSWTEIISNPDKAFVIIGARSALFAPLSNVGLVVVDEAHEPSLKQDQSPKYSALRVASVLGKLHKASVVFGSATPLITEKYSMQKLDKPVLYLNSKAVDGAKPPDIDIVDMRTNTARSTHSIFSKNLLDQIKSALDNDSQILIYHNRRGTHNLSLCKSCGWQAGCKNCFVPMTLHSDQHILLCHICSYKTNIPTSCPSCGSTDVVYKGAGTKLIEQELNKLFPKAKIARFDSDNSAKESITYKYHDVYNGEVDIIIGTQIIAKGLDLPHLTLVGIIQADSGLSIPDYTSSERTFQLLTQVIGRVGRTTKESKIIIQTYQPEHPSITFGSKQDYEGFFSHELKIRQKSMFPPFCYLLLLRNSYKKEATAVDSAKKLAIDIKQKYKNVAVVGPTPSFYERRGGGYSWQLIIKSKNRQSLLEIVKQVPAGRWQVDIDPSSLL